MTALDDYAKLEAEGQYFDGVSPSPKAVVVGFGERSLVITDFKDQVLAHWPLASLRQTSQGEDIEVALVPDPNSAEQLLLRDSDMIEAIGKVCPDLRSPNTARPRRRRSKWRWALLLIAMVAALVGLAPGQTVHLAAFVPADREQALGAALADQVALALGKNGNPIRVCAGPEGRAALLRLTNRLMPKQPLAHPLRVTILDDPAASGIALPGGRILLMRGLIDRAQSSEEIAGALAHLIGHVSDGDPLRRALMAGRWQAIVGVSVGDLVRQGVLDPTVVELLQGGPEDLEAESRADEAAYLLLAQAGLPSRPYADLMTRLEAQQTSDWLRLHPDPGQRAAAARSADSIGSRAFAPALNDRNWIALQNICDE